MTKTDEREQVARDRATIAAALQSWAKSEADRDSLSPGETPVTIEIRAVVDSERQHQARLEGRLTVGADSVVASSSAVDVAHLTALFLGKFSRAVRVKLLAELPDAFADAGTLPDVSAERLAEATLLLKRLRAKKDSTRRGPVRFSVERQARRPLRLHDRGDGRRRALDDCQL